MLRFAFSRSAAFPFYEHGFHTCATLLARHRVVVANLHPRCTAAELRATFGKCGPVRSVTLLEDPLTRKMRLAAVLEFDEGSAAQQALQYNGTQIRGRTIKCLLANSQMSN
eukprot:TRINITY_DN1885_c0_g2_i1.p1 TRINITY_DN1885_c0_g2~~TRINITY_DN1885_c0_g2_i1.p1  ORF type:complete len:111 (+),score=20.73 TRINITY_DN1885_c0_g2_i1:23-355(+)